MTYQYPTKHDVEHVEGAETTALTVAMTAVLDALDECPLSDALKVYVLCELACKLCPVKYVEEVINEIRVMKEFPQ
jgi:hypothetical protein